VIEETSIETRRKLAARWKIVGIVVLVAGLAFAPIYYWIQSRQMEQSLGELLPGYEKSMQREVAIQMGPLGLVLMQWSDALARPGVQAFLIALGAVVLWRGCVFVAARLSDDGSHETTKPRNS
jgi:hypothetical protein